MPVERFTADLESGLTPDSGPWSHSSVGCADLSWSALRCTLGVAEEAARNLYSCVAWASAESQKDFEAWTAAKKDDDLFSPLRPPRQAQILQANDSSAVVATLAAPVLQADFGRVDKASKNDAAFQPEAHKVAAALRRSSFKEDPLKRNTGSAAIWEDFRCSPARLEPASALEPALANVAAPETQVAPGYALQRQGQSKHLALDLPDLIDASAKARQALASPDYALHSSPRPRPVSIQQENLKMGQILGKGSFAVVYKGRWQGQTVAIKVLDGAAATSQKAMKEFTREMDMMSHLPDHPNILKLLGACIAPDKLILVMQHCSRGSLYQLLHSPSAYLTWQQLVGICLATAQGMLHLHSHQALHRDLKSGNILLDEHGVVKVADFGLSRLQAATCAEPLTAELGTWQWMAPEVVAPWDKKGAIYTEKADVYSFGIVMWECAAREVPFKQYDGHQAAVMATYKGMRPAIPRETPEPLIQLIKECWSPAYGQRPGFADIVPRLQRLFDSYSDAHSVISAELKA